MLVFFGKRRNKPRRRIINTEMLQSEYDCISAYVKEEIMQPTGSQTGLKVISILDIIGGIFMLLMGFLLFAGGAVMGEDPSLGAGLR